MTSCKSDLSSYAKCYLWPIYTTRRYPLSMRCPRFNNCWWQARYKSFKIRPIKGSSVPYDSARGGIQACQYFWLVPIFVIKIYKFLPSKIAQVYESMFLFG